MSGGGANGPAHNGGSGGGTQAPKPPAPPPVQSLDGTGNNLANPTWGSTNQQLLRTVPSEYGDGVSSPAGADRPSARAVSNALADEDEATLNDRHMTSMVYAWGQFLDHDIDLTPGASPREAFNIAVPAGDPEFDPSGAGDKIIPLGRSQYDTTTGTSAANPRQQVNTITSFVDASEVYGSDATRAAALRTFSGGLMKTSEGDLPPLNTLGLANANDAHRVADDQLFLAGDVRANENFELTSLHALFVREHNRLAGELAAANPTWTDEQLYQGARRVVIAEMQVITYNEFLPTLLGADALKPYNGYRSDVNPGISNEFSTAAFRVGHTLLGEDIDFLDNDGNDVREPVELRDAFFNPDVLKETGVDPILNYLATANAREVDTKVVEDVRNFLFGPPGAGGFDLASLNIQRGRDHGLADYNAARAAYGLPKVTDFSQITSDVEVQDKLRALYGDVDNIDLWVGGLAEDHVPGSSVGPTFRRIIADQFERLRDGDRFWYQNTFRGEELDKIGRLTLADVIHRNTGAEASDHVFYDQTTMVTGTNPQRGGDVALLMTADSVKLVDRPSGRVIENRTTASTEMVVLRGSDPAPDRVMLDARQATAGLPQLEVDGGAARGDMLVVRLPAGVSEVKVTPRTIEFNGEEIVWTRFEALNLQTGPKAPKIIVTEGVRADVLVNGQRLPPPPAAQTGAPTNGAPTNGAPTNSTPQNGAPQNATPGAPPPVGGQTSGQPPVISPTGSGGTGGARVNWGGAPASNRVGSSAATDAALSNLPPLSPIDDTLLGIVARR